MYYLCNFLYASVNLSEGGGGMRKGEGGSADLIQKLAMACFHFKASQPELNIFAFNFDSNSTEDNGIIPI